MVKKRRRERRAKERRAAIEMKMNFNFRNCLGLSVGEGKLGRGGDFIDFLCSIIFKK